MVQSQSADPVRVETLGSSSSSDRQTDRQTINLTIKENVAMPVSVRK